MLPAVAKEIAISTINSRCSSEMNLKRGVRVTCEVQPKQTIYRNIQMFFKTNKEKTRYPPHARLKTKSI